MDIEEHLKESNGKGKEIHEFLDQFYSKFKEDHRCILHHEVGIELTVRRFGEESRNIAINHIISDIGRIPKDFRDKRYDVCWYVTDIETREKALKVAGELDKSM